ncbi:MAG: YegS/Rv2252/BmrU family lipid kinase [Defluviitaleaceae bacterium]|nr:YegS/Rv2252/BmrU family lipid kinase [Defluviitaleaceae bacterium]MCL2275990.1 YegS/Rv2252/BmrU family lipid kinase [Defluviitaleaceae bacterium]
MKNLKKMLLIFNPHAGTQKFPPQLFDVVDRFNAAGYLVTAYASQQVGDVSTMITEYASGYDCLVCSGGDGTIAEAVGALMNVEKPPRLGIIPSGTVNDFSASLGIPTDIMAAADIIVSAGSHLIDIGRFGSAYFTYVAAFGKFTDVPYTTPQSVKNIFGKLAYFLEGVKQAGTMEAVRCDFVLDGERISGDFLLGIVANAHSIAGYKLPQEMDVQIDDGYFEVILIHMPSSLLEIPKILSMLVTQEIKEDVMIFRKARSIEISAEYPIAWTLDGDYGGEHTYVFIENLNQAATVIYDYTSQAEGI